MITSVNRWTREMLRNTSVDQVGNHYFLRWKTLSVNGLYCCQESKCFGCTQGGHSSICLSIAPNLDIFPKEFKTSQHWLDMTFFSKYRLSNVIAMDETAVFMGKDLKWQLIREVPYQSMFPPLVTKVHVLPLFCQLVWMERKPQPARGCELVEEFMVSNYWQLCYHCTYWQGTWTRSGNLRRVLLLDMRDWDGKWNCKKFKQEFSVCRFIIIIQKNMTWLYLTKGFRKYSDWRVS